MLPLISFVDENHLHYINWDAKVYDFINQDSKEWNLQSISSILHLNVLSDIKAILIPSYTLCDRIFWGSSQDGKSTLKSATWAMRKPLMTLDPNYYIGFGNYIYAKFKILHMANYSKSLPTCEFVIQKNGNFKHVFRVWGLGFGVWGLGFGVQGLGFGVQGLGFGVWGLGFRFQGLGVRVQGLGLRVEG